MEVYTELRECNDDVVDPICSLYMADNSEGANLYNKEGLKAFPFRTDIFERSKQ